MNSAQSSAVGPQSLISALIAALLILFSTLAVYQPPNKHYAYMIIEAPENLSITFLLNGRKRAVDCEATITKLASALLASCSACRIKQLQCLTKLDVTQQYLLSSEPLDSTSSRLPGGVAIYTAPSLATALATCQESQRLAAKSTAPMTCFPANTARSLTEPTKTVDAAQALWAAFALIAAGFGAWFTCWLIIRYEHLHAHFSLDQAGSGPQKFHSVPTPRIGGVGLLAGLLAGGGVLLALQPQFKFNTADFGYLLLAGTPAFLGGIAEDVTKKVGVLHRLLMTMLAGSLGAWLLGAILNRLNIPGIDTALLWLPFAVAFTVFAVGGIANAINIIDGYNGLAGGFAVIVLIATHDRQVAGHRKHTAISGGHLAGQRAQLAGGRIGHRLADPDQRSLVGRLGSGHHQGHGQAGRAVGHTSGKVGRSRVRGRGGVVGQNDLAGHGVDDAITAGGHQHPAHRERIAEAIRGGRRLRRGRLCVRQSPYRRHQQHQHTHK